MNWLLSQSALIVGLTVLGGCLPLLFERSSRLLHLLVSLAAGIFLGAVFLHLLPEVAAHMDHGGEGAHAAHGGWLAVVTGVLVLYFVESLFLRGDAVDEAHVHKPAPVADESGAGGFVFSSQPAQPATAAHVCHEDHIGGHDRHRMVGLAALIGLTLHAIADGLGLSVGVEDPELRGALAMTILSHKALGGFSLAIALLLSRMPVRRVLGLVALFALVTPLAAILRTLLLPDLGAASHELLTAFAAGTFLYVALCDLLPEVFHERRDGLLKAALLVAGVATSHFLHEL